MAKNAVSDWDTTAGNNTDVGGVNIAEGCAPANINNALREMMKQIAEWIALAALLADNETVSGDWTFSGAADFTGTVDLTSSTLSGIYSRSAATATTSGTSFNFSSIPSWANEVIVNFRNVSLSGTDTIVIQLGDSGGIETTAYECVHGYITTAANITRNNNTAGIAIGPLSGGDGLYGSVTFTNYGGNTWNASGQLVDNGNEYHFTAGSKTLSDVLTQLTVTRSGSSTFDAGGISVAWRR